MILSANKNGATSANVTPLRIPSVGVTKMLKQDTTSDVGLLDAVLNLEEAAKAAWLADTSVNIYRHGRRFERSGDSMAVFDGDRRIDRVTLRNSSERAFLEAIDAWEMAYYLEAA